MRYVNVTLIDTTGTPTSTQIPTHDLDTWGPAIAWMEDKIAGSRRYRHVLPFIAAFMYDTRSGKMLQYAIDGLRACIVKREA